MLGPVASVSGLTLDSGDLMHQRAVLYRLTADFLVLTVAGHAPVSKGLVLLSIGSTVIQSAARSSHRRLPQPLVTSSKALAFKSPGELLFGCLLL